MYGPDDDRAWDESLHPRVPAGQGGGGEFGAAPKSGHGEAPAKKTLGPPKGTLAFNPGKNHGPGYGIKGGDSHVHALQEALNRLGVTDGRGHKLADDGKLGPLTTQAIKAAQQRLGLRADGRVTPELYSRLLGLTSLPGGRHTAEPAAHHKPHHAKESGKSHPAAKEKPATPPAKKLAVGGSGGNKLRSAMDPAFVRADLHPGDGNAEQLHQYWVHGEGAAKIGWGTPGDFDRCVVQLKEHAHFTDGQAKGYCNLAHHAATGMYPAQHAELEKGHRGMSFRAGADINDLPDSDFAYIEPGGTKDSEGKTTPRSLRHFPIHDAEHVRNALARASQSPFGDKAMPKILKAAKKFGVDVGDGSADRKEEFGMSAVERRFTLMTVEYRGDDSAPRIGGYAAMFSRVSRNLGGFVEVVERSFFNKSRGDGWPDVMCRYNHDDNMLLGTTGAGTLRLNLDDTGLDYNVNPPNSRADVVELVQRGDVRKSSFAFRVPNGGEEWGLSDQGYPMRHLLTGQLIDVAPVNAPAYLDTSAAMRSLAAAKEADVEEVRSAAEADELRRFFVRTDNRGPAPKPKPGLFGPAAAAALLARRQDPYV